MFQLHDESMKLLRLQRYIGRQKFLVAFIDASQGADRSRVATGIREQWPEFERTGGVVLGVTAVRPAENRGDRTRRRVSVRPALGSERSRSAPPMGGQRREGNELREAVVIVDRAGLIRFVHYAPDSLGSPEQWARELSQVR